MSQYTYNANWTAIARSLATRWPPTIRPLLMDHLRYPPPPPTPPRTFFFFSFFFCAKKQFVGKDYWPRFQFPALASAPLVSLPPRAKRVLPVKTNMVKAESLCFWDGCKVSSNPGDFINVRNVNCGSYCWWFAKKNCGSWPQYSVFTEQHARQAQTILDLFLHCKEDIVFENGEVQPLQGSRRSMAQELAWLGNGKIGSSLIKI